jgi:hypothetical protein
VRTTTAQQASCADIIRGAADRHHVSRQVALAFSWVESRHDPACEGDLHWHTKLGGKLYQNHVVRAERLARNPARNDPPVWHSYGLFQLLACYFVGPLEHPILLRDPVINADRGCKEIRRLLDKNAGDVRAARLQYVGCGPKGELCAEPAVSKIVNALTLAMERFGSEEGIPL